MSTGRTRKQTTPWESHENTRTAQASDANINSPCDKVKGGSVGGKPVDHMTPRDAAKRPQRRDMELCTAPAKRGSVPPSSEEVCMFSHVVKPQSSRVPPHARSCAMGARREVALAEELTGGWAQGEQSGQVRSGQNSMWNWDREMRNIVGDKILYREIRMASSNVKIPDESQATERCEIAKPGRLRWQPSSVVGDCGLNELELLDLFTSEAMQVVRPYQSFDRTWYRGSASLLFALEAQTAEEGCRWFLLTSVPLNQTSQPVAYIQQRLGKKRYSKPGRHAKAPFLIFFP
ncbi:hypothetical protein Q7P36_006370 [Cladosporium allicinum]